jgi:hypothetical protein
VSRGMVRLSRGVVAGRQDLNALTVVRGDIQIGRYVSRGTNKKLCQGPAYCSSVLHVEPYI